jgi:hypothetical protein
LSLVRLCLRYFFQQAGGSKEDIAQAASDVAATAVVKQTKDLSHVEAEAGKAAEKMVRATGGSVHDRAKAAGAAAAKASLLNGKDESAAGDAAKKAAAAAGGSHLDQKTAATKGTFDALMHNAGASS